jgi:hypothetical protein
MAGMIDLHLRIPRPVLRRLARAALLAAMLVPLLPATGRTWGSEVHHYVAQHYSQDLPPYIDGLQAYDTVVDQESTVPDERKSYTPGEAVKHYIDIDVYPEFLAGTLPHDRTALEAIYGAGTVESNGVLPWAIAATVTTLTQQLHDRSWSAAALTIGDLSHYVADATQPLHCTENYDGQLTGQNGIHSRYESAMMTLHMGDLSTPVLPVGYRANANEAAFSCIGDSWAGVAGLLLADEDAARATSGVYNATYYAQLWSSTSAMTRARIDSAVVLTASLVYSAWVNAGHPNVPGSSEPWNPDVASGVRLSAGPNPFSGAATISWAGPGPLTLDVLDVRGAHVVRLADHVDGEGTVTWSASSGAAALRPGVYFVRLAGPGVKQVRRICLVP